MTIETASQSQYLGIWDLAYWMENNYPLGMSYFIASCLWASRSKVISEIPYQVYAYVVDMPARKLRYFSVLGVVAGVPNNRVRYYGRMDLAAQSCDAIDVTLQGFNWPIGPNPGYQTPPWDMIEWNGYMARLQVSP